VTQEHLEHLEGIPQDVTFTFPEEGGATVSAHRFVLAAASDVFKANFFGGLPQEKVVAILNTSREDFTTFLDLLYGKDVNVELLSMTRLLALSGLEDRFLTHQRRALRVVAVRRVTAEDTREVMDLDTSDAFAEAVGAAMRRDLEKAKDNRISCERTVELIKVTRYLDYSGVGMGSLLKKRNERKLELMEQMEQSQQMMQVEMKKLQQLKEDVEGRVVQKKVWEVMELVDWLRGKEREGTRMTIIGDFMEDQRNMVITGKEELDLIAEKNIAKILATNTYIEIKFRKEEFMCVMGVGGEKVV